jgi:hypothetical protein
MTTQSMTKEYNKTNANNVLLGIILWLAPAIVMISLDKVIDLKPSLTQFAILFILLIISNKMLRLSSNNSAISFAISIPIIPILYIFIYSNESLIGATILIYWIAMIISLFFTAVINSILAKRL